MLRRLSFLKYARVAKALARNMAARENIYPFYASFKLTRKCHFSCRFCNVKNNDLIDMPTGKIKRVMDNLSQSSAILVSFEGGEPLLRKDVGELLKYARTKDFYLLFTTSERHLERYPMKEYAKCIDFLHVSIDEGHNNMELFDRLGEFASYGTRLSVQIVVEKNTLSDLAKKIDLCSKVKANAVIMPAVNLDETNDFFPDLVLFEEEIARLRKLYPSTIYTPKGYFKAVRDGKCSTASVVIDSDGFLFYPCHIIGEKLIDLSEVDLMDWLKSDSARSGRADMHACMRKCGWFQYFSITDFTSPISVFNAISPLLKRGLP